MLKENLRLQTQTNENSFVELTLEEIHEFTRSVDIKLLSAAVMSGTPDCMYARLNKLGVEWTNLMGPVWVGDVVVMVMIRPRDDDAEYNKRVFEGECTNGWELQSSEENEDATGI